MYNHPLGGARGIEGQGLLRTLHYLPPEARVAAAVGRNAAWLVEALALTGHDCKVASASGYTPLHTAARYDFWECVTVLIAAGAPVNAPTVRQ
jgi:hypothetical protein